MIEGMWAVYFNADNGGAPGVGPGAGVVVLETGRVFGGDSSYYYTGDYDVAAGGRVTARIRVRHYAGPRNNIFGAVQDASLEVSGILLGREQAMMGGHVVGAPQQRIALGFVRLADLP